MSYVNVVFGNKVLFLLILFTANLKASSSALTSETGPSVCSKIPPKTQKQKTNKKKISLGAVRTCIKCDGKLNETHKHTF